MTKQNKHTLPNGYTFLAVTSGSYGYWEKATDPITAIRNCYSRTSRRSPEPIYLIYGKDSELKINELGGYGYDVKNLPVACGIFYVTSRTIRPVKKGDFNQDHSDCLQWQKEQIADHERQRDWWAKAKKKTA